MQDGAIVSCRKREQAGSSSVGSRMQRLRLVDICPADLSSRSATPRPTLVLYYLPSANLFNVFNAASYAAGELGVGVFARLDASEHRELQAQYRLKQGPALVWHTHGRFAETVRYDGQLTDHGSIVAFAQPLLARLEAARRSPSADASTGYHPAAARPMSRSSTILLLAANVALAVGATYAALRSPWRAEVLVTGAESKAAAVAIRPAAALPLPFLLGAAAYLPNVVPARWGAVARDCGGAASGDAATALRLADRAISCATLAVLVALRASAVDFPRLAMLWIGLVASVLVGCGARNGRIQQQHRGEPSADDEEVGGVKGGSVSAFYEVAHRRRSLWAFSIHSAMWGSAALGILGNHERPAGTAAAGAVLFVEGAFFWTLYGIRSLVGGRDFSNELCGTLALTSAKAACAGLLLRSGS